MVPTRHAIKNTLCLKAFAKLVVVAAMNLWLLGCGDDPEQGYVDTTQGPNVGIGWVDISIPTSAASYDTELASVELSGGSFISPTASCPTGRGDLGPGYKVTWSNAANGSSGQARAGLNCLVIVFAWWKVDSGVIRLEIGPNRITVAATDSAGNVGRDTITITRHQDTTPPTVTSTAPMNGATAVAINASPTATFSEPMDVATINTSTFLLRDDRSIPVSGTVNYNSFSNTATFVPSGTLAYSTTYSATITMGAKDQVGGNALAATYSWSFTTGSNPDTTSPQVSRTSPVDGSYCAAIDGTITATFTEDIAPSTISLSSFTLSAAGSLLIPGALSYANQTATFRPAAALSFASPYTATISTGVKDLAGNALTSDYVWTFSTISGPGVGSWAPTLLTGAPAARTRHVAVWTGTEMIIAGGDNFSQALRTGGKYNPTTGTWTPISFMGLTAGTNMTAVWTGAEMILWGGKFSGFANAGGARYDPATDTWRSVSQAGSPSGRYDHASLWTGQVMLVWGGQDGTTIFNTGGRYDPATDTWHPISTAGAPSARRAHSAVWTGSEMIVWGGFTIDALDANDGAAYNPDTDTWRPITTNNAPTGRYGHSAVWTGSEMIIWGSEFPPTNSGAKYSPSTDTWQVIDTACAPSIRQRHTAVWTGTKMIVWGGLSGGYFVANGVSYDPATNAWAQITTTTEPSPRRDHTAVWTGTEMVIWGGDNLSPLNSGGRHAP